MRATTRTTMPLSAHQRHQEPRKARAKPRHLEDDEQAALIRWARLHAGKYPELGLLFHIPNGGKRNPREAARLKAQGVVAGVSDLLLPVRCDQDSGLWLEMKSARGKVTPEQAAWIRAMERHGFQCAVCRSWRQAAQAIINYLGLPLEV